MSRSIDFILLCAVIFASGGLANAASGCSSGGCGSKLWSVGGFKFYCCPMDIPTTDPTVPPTCTGFDNTDPFADPACKTPGYNSSSPLPPAPPSACPNGEIFSF